MALNAWKPPKRNCWAATDAAGLQCNKQPNCMMKNYLRNVKNSLCGVAVMCAACAAASGCTDDVEDLYAHFNAFLHFPFVTGVPMLHAALHNGGEFCQITYDDKYFYFKDNNGNTQSYGRTGWDTSYRKPMSVAGFVTGVPSVPDMNMQQNAVAYDLACPTCYEQSLIQRSLTFSAREEMTCPRCGSVYDLKTGNIVSSPRADAQKRLYRYHITFNGTGSGVLVISN